MHDTCIYIEKRELSVCMCVCLSVTELFKTCRDISVRQGHDAGQLRVDLHFGAGLSEKHKVSSPRNSM